MQTLEANLSLGTNKSELKLPRAGLLRDVLFPQERTPEPQYDNLIVFGQGPVIGKSSRAIPSIGEQEDINMWGKSVARAAAEMKLAGMVGKIVITGGKTGGDGFKSEAELMREVMQKEYPEIPVADILLESKATNTLENFAYTLNSLDIGGSVEKTAFLGSDYHITRIKQLASLYGFENPQGFSAESIFKLIASRTHDEHLMSVVERMLSVNDDLSGQDSRFVLKEFEKLSDNEKLTQPSKSMMRSKTFFEVLSGTEQKGVLQRIKEEQRWAKGLTDIPEYWIGYLGYLQSDVRLKSVLDRLAPVLADMGVRSDESLDQIRQKLLEFTKEGIRRIPPEEWENI